MIVERVTVQNFRCFGPASTEVRLDPKLTALIGANGSGKTALILALLRMFGINAEQRRVRRQDFYVPPAEVEPPTGRQLTVETVFSFPELVTGGADKAKSVPNFFHQMAADDDGALKCRFRLEATWTDDGSVDGAVEQRIMAVRTLSNEFNESQCTEIKGADRGRIQMLYIPARRDASSQVEAFLRGRLWRAIMWSKDVKVALSGAGAVLNGAFCSELGIAVVAKAITRRWSEVHTAGTDSTPVFRPIDLRFEQFVRKVEVLFHPDESGRLRGLDELSDGQRSLFHISMAAATLDIESQLAQGADIGFDKCAIAIPSLTLMAMEEPENSLSPFYISRIVHQLLSLSEGSATQSLVSSHSPSTLSRVGPEQVRHFRMDIPTRTCRIREIRIPDKAEEASKYIREAVRAHPELYFARFVVLGEGDSEEVILPRLAEAMGVPIDRSFVAMVPLGGRHVHHLWRLLSDLGIPYATLLDLDLGRHGGGSARLKYAIEQLEAVGVDRLSLFDSAFVEAIKKLTVGSSEWFLAWLIHLRKFGVFYSWHLDLDMSMLMAFGDSYWTLEPGSTGPRSIGDPRRAVLGDEGEEVIPLHENWYVWYRYLFLGQRGKPSTHVRVLSNMDLTTLASKTPEGKNSALMISA